MSSRPEVSGGPVPSLFAQSSSQAGFFHHHGWLAPGVRLFRRIGFAAKAASVAAAFLTPLALTLAFVWSASTEQIAFAASERDGLRYVRPLLALAVAAQARRLASATGGGDWHGLQDRVEAAFDAMQTRHAERGEAFGTRKGFETLQGLHRPLLAPEAGARTDAGAAADANFRAHSAYIDAVLDLVRHIADGSQLALDPDLDTYHMMNVSVLRAPLQIELTARLAALGTFALRGHASARSWRQ